MLSYDLCRSLKDAGYTHLCKDAGELCSFGIDRDCYCVHLEELIEACGPVHQERFGPKELIIWVHNGTWHAGYYSGGGDAYVDDYPTLNETGESPESAVAALWLELNNKGLNETNQKTTTGDRFSCSPLG